MKAKIGKKITTQLWNQRLESPNFQTADYGRLCTWQRYIQKEFKENWHILSPEVRIMLIEDAEEQVRCAREKCPFNKMSPKYEPGVSCPECVLKKTKRLQRMLKDRD